MPSYYYLLHLRTYYVIPYICSFCIIRSVQPLEALDDILRLDGNCLRNLNLVPLSDKAGPGPQAPCSVFHIINRTRTRFGARYARYILLNSVGKMKIEYYLEFLRLLRQWLLKPLANHAAIKSRLEAVDWFVKHYDDAELGPLKKLLKSQQDLEKQLTAVLHERSRPKDFYALCWSWNNVKILCIKLQSDYHNTFPASLASLLDIVVHSLDVVTHYVEQLNETAISSEDKTKLFKHIGNYPEMEILVEKIHQVESQLQVYIFFVCFLFLYLKESKINDQFRPLYAGIKTVHL